MKKALLLAANGIGSVAPNPFVGAVVVKNDIVIGSGYHELYGGPHAEVNAINNCSESPVGSTVYCNLEPCSHYNKQTPPCAQFLINNKVKRVIISTLDPNPSVSGNGVKLLREAGIEVIVGVLKTEAEALNEVFFKYIKSHHPFVHIKLAQTLDGKIATLAGDSKWISDEDARVETHRLRMKYDAILIGRNTLTFDNANLTIRMGVESKGKVPYRIIVGNIMNIDLKLNIFIDGHSDKNIIITTINNFNEAKESLLKTHRELGTKFIFTDSNNGSLNLNQAFKKLGEMKISSVLVEGGTGVISSLINEEIADKLSFYICPILLGDGINSFQKKSILKMKDALRFSNSKVRNLNGQAVVEIYPNFKTTKNIGAICLLD